MIIGMDWLSKSDGVIQCVKRSILLTSPPGGDRIEFVATLPSVAYLVVNQLEGNRLEDIRVVCEFPDVFPDDSLVLPPDRDIEFVIEIFLALHPYLREERATSLCPRSTRLKKRCVRNLY